MEKACDQRVPVKQEKEPSVQEIINQEKENIHSSLGSFLPPMTINAISHRNPDLSDWKKLTTDILVEIYGKELAFLSAKGRRGARGIDPNVYRSVYDLINMRLGWILPSKEFVRHVNKVCSNRKKYARKPPAGTSTSQEVVSEEDPIATLEQGDFDHHHEIQYPDSNFCTIQISETYSQAQM
ncbi:GSCOCG00013639001-RA-CDS [Cotesia congregata]|nr:GSCOCG00013639001-RA-CDS [Cotesia congregata]